MPNSANQKYGGTPAKKKHHSLLFSSQTANLKKKQNKSFIFFQISFLHSFTIFIGLEKKRRKGRTKTVAVVVVVVVVVVAVVVVVVVVVCWVLSLVSSIALPI